MPDLNDFHAFESTTDGSSGGSGCFGSVFSWIVAVIIVLWIIGKIFG